METKYFSGDADALEIDQFKDLGTRELNETVRLK